MTRPNPGEERLERLPIVGVFGEFHLILGRLQLADEPGLATEADRVEEHRWVRLGPAPHRRNPRRLVRPVRLGRAVERRRRDRLLLQIENEMVVGRALAGDQDREAAQAEAAGPGDAPRHVDQFELRRVGLGAGKVLEEVCDRLLVNRKQLALELGK